MSEPGAEIFKKCYLCSSTPGIDKLFHLLEQDQTCFYKLWKIESALDLNILCLRPSVSLFVSSSLGALCRIELRANCTLGLQFTIKGLPPPKAICMEEFLYSLQFTLLHIYNRLYVCQVPSVMSDSF